MKSNIYDLKFYVAAVVVFGIGLDSLNGACNNDCLVVTRWLWGSTCFNKNVGSCVSDTLEHKAPGNANANCTSSGTKGGAQIYTGCTNACTGSPNGVPWQATGGVFSANTSLFNKDCTAVGS